MRPNLNLMKATITGALGGLLFGFDTVVISGVIDALVKLYGLGAYGKGWTVAIALIGTVVGSFGAGVVGQKLGGRETLRITAVLYVVSALGSAFAWGWPSLMVFRFLGGLGIGASSVLGPVYKPSSSRQVEGPIGRRVPNQRSAWNPGGVCIQFWHSPAASWRDGVALAGGRGRNSGGRFPGAIVCHPTQPPMVGFKIAH